MVDWDDPDLEASPYGYHGHGIRRTGNKAREGAYDLKAMRHRIRNTLEDYSYLASGGDEHDRILMRLGLSPDDWSGIHDLAVRQGLAMPVNAQPTNSGNEEEWN